MRRSGHFRGSTNSMNITGAQEAHSANAHHPARATASTTNTKSALHLSFTATLQT